MTSPVVPGMMATVTCPALPDMLYAVAPVGGEVFLIAVTTNAFCEPTVDASGVVNSKVHGLVAVVVAVPVIETVYMFPTFTYRAYNIDTADIFVSPFAIGVYSPLIAPLP